MVFLVIRFRLVSLSNRLLGLLLEVPSCNSLNWVRPLYLNVEPLLNRLLVDGRLDISVLTVLKNVWCSTQDFQSVLQADLDGQVNPMISI